QVEVDQFLFDRFGGGVLEAVGHLVDQQVAETFASAVESRADGAGVGRFAGCLGDLLGQLGGAEIGMLNPHSQHCVVELSRFGLLLFQLPPDAIQEIVAPTGEKGLVVGGG